MITYCTLLSHLYEYVSLIDIKIMYTPHLKIACFAGGLHCSFLGSPHSLGIVLSLSTLSYQNVWVKKKAMSFDHMNCS
jgi:hypothetical protein